MYTSGRKGANGRKTMAVKSESISDSELIQQLSVLDNVQFPPQLKNKLISLLPVNEVAEPAHHYDSEKRIQELELLLTLVEAKHKNKSLSIFGSMEGCFTVDSNLDLQQIISMFFLGIYIYFFFDFIIAFLSLRF